MSQCNKVRLINRVNINFQENETASGTITSNQYNASLFLIIRVLYGLTANPNSFFSFQKMHLFSQSSLISPAFCLSHWYKSKSLRGVKWVNFTIYFTAWGIFMELLFYFVTDKITTTKSLEVALNPHFAQHFLFPFRLTSWSWQAEV